MSKKFKTGNDSKEKIIVDYGNVTIYEKNPLHTTIHPTDKKVSEVHEKDHENSLYSTKTPTPEGTPYFLKFICSMYTDFVTRLSYDLSAVNGCLDEDKFRARLKRLSGSPVEYGRFLRYVYDDIGRQVGLVVWSPLSGDRFVKFGSEDTKNPHRHGIWIFELHVLDHEVSLALGNYLGLPYGYKMWTKGSWHYFNNDASGFDICHVRCLSKLLTAVENDVCRLRKDTGWTIDEALKHRINGQKLFMKVFPDAGKIQKGNNRLVAGWLEGENFVSVKERAK